MAAHRYQDEEASPSLESQDNVSARRDSTDSLTSASMTSLIFDRIKERNQSLRSSRLSDDAHRPDAALLSETFEIKSFADGSDEAEGGGYGQHTPRPIEKRLRRWLWVLSGLLLSSWLMAFSLYLSSRAYRHASETPHDPSATVSRGSGKSLTLDQVQSGLWRPQLHSISWIENDKDEDGLLLERSDGGAQGDWLVVRDVRSWAPETMGNAKDQIILMKGREFSVGGEKILPAGEWPSRDLKHVLIVSNKQKNWRHSFIGNYWILNVADQTVEPLDPEQPRGRIQLAKWSPQSDAIVFTRDNNMFLRELSSKKVIQITKDGGANRFYGVPDWVFEEEVFASDTATWWAGDGKYIAFLCTNEEVVPDYPVEYFLSRPSGESPAPGEKNYPETRQIKYPKAGAPNPVVSISFYDVEKREVFNVTIENDFRDEDRLITEVIWAGSSGQVLIRETNRESDILRIILVDVKKRTGKLVREVDVTAIDGGWFEVSQQTTYIPADPANGRPHEGYIDNIIYQGFDHIGYFTPLDAKDPIVLTSGKWEVTDEPPAVDLKNNLVYFHSTVKSSLERHIQSVKLDGTEMRLLPESEGEGYFRGSFSKGAGFVLLSYEGPNIPWQNVISTPSNNLRFSHTIESNPVLKKMAADHELPIDMFSTVNIDGFELNVVERRPPHFNPKKSYPVLFHLYGGPGSQTVSKKWLVDFQKFVAANLGYIVVTVDGRGTGFIGRKARVAVRGNLGHLEAHDQIETAKIWAGKSYVDSERIAIWGWSYGGYMTLKTLEQDAGSTFKYGMAVAPVTDWRFYDSIYTERYMHTPQHNPDGYDNASISDTSALSRNVRFLIMHGVADDNVHLQNTLTLIDKLDLASVENYDVMVFPDSDHGIYFHNANRIVYDKLKNWIVNAFNGEWLRIDDPVPIKRSIEFISAT